MPFVKRIAVNLFALFMIVVIMALVAAGTNAPLGIAAGAFSLLVASFLNLIYVSLEQIRLANSPVATAPLPKK